MGLRNIFGLLMFLGFVWFKVEGDHGGHLSYGFYDETCPEVEDIVKAGLLSISISDPTSPAALLRLMFHDCQVQGCDASILVDPDAATMMPSEMASGMNFGIQKREWIGLIKSKVEAVCTRQVSCADILILAAREAVSMAGGPRIYVPLGRRDSASPPSPELANAVLPPADLGVDGMLRVFAEKGMSIEESVAIMGAHTLGVTHCLTILSRLYGRQDGDATAEETEPEFQRILKLSCPVGSLLSPNTSLDVVLNDPTSFIFDNQYYGNAMRGRGILKIDSELPLDPRTSPFVERFAADQDEFFRAFSSAFVKLSSFGVLTGDRGVVRAVCNVN